MFQHNSQTVYIWMLGRPTPGDTRYYERWQEAGHVLSGALVGAPPISVIVTDQHRLIDEGLLKFHPTVKYVVSPTTGHTHLQFDPDRRGIKLITLRGETEFLHGIKSVSEFTMRQILTISRPKTGLGNLVSGKTLGIVGLGRIGKQVSVLASSFGMKVVHVDKGTPDWAWTNLFKTSDFVSIHLDENDSTKKLISKELLNLMKPSAYLINTARPSVIDEAHLKMALVNLDIAGAALDVTDLDWSDCENCLVTPHIAGNTLEDRVRTDEFVLDKLKGHLGGRRVREMN